MSAEAVFATSTFHVVPLSIDLSIWLPVMAEPPSLDGADQLRSICDDETAVADRFVGGCGTVGGAPVVEVATFDGALIPTELIA